MQLEVFQVTRDNVTETEPQSAGKQRKQLLLKTQCQLQRRGEGTPAVAVSTHLSSLIRLVQSVKKCEGPAV